MLGPIEIIWTPGRRVPMTAHPGRHGRRRAWDPIRRDAKVPRAASSNGESKSGRQGGYERCTRPPRPRGARRLQSGDHLLESGCARAAGHRREGEHACGGAGDVQARARLHHAWKPRAHGGDARRKSCEQVERSRRGRLLSGFAGADRLDGDHDTGVGVGVLVAQRRELVFRGSAERRLGTWRKHDDRPRLARDGVSADAAVEGR
jgi:hypothetical protein